VSAKGGKSTSRGGAKADSWAPSGRKTKKSGIGAGGKNQFALAIFPPYLKVEEGPKRGLMFPSRTLGERRPGLLKTWATGFKRRKTYLRGGGRPPGRVDFCSRYGGPSVRGSATVGTKHVPFLCQKTGFLFFPNRGNARRPKVPEFLQNRDGPPIFPY